MAVKVDSRGFASLALAMLNTPQPCTAPPGGPPTSGDASALLAHARALKAAALSGTIQPLLKGKKLGLLCESTGHPDAVLFCQAARELGAHVAHIRAGLDLHSPRHEIEHTARMLGRLYDAIECQGLPTELIRQVGHDAGVPVYEGIATRGHPCAGLADNVAIGTPAEDDRRFIVQAILLSTLA